MNERWSKWKERWGDAHDAILRLGGEVEPVSIAPPATEQDVLAVEAELGARLPDSFREVLLGFSERVEFSWSLPETVLLPKSLSAIFSGACGWDLARIIDEEASRRDWVETCFDDEEEDYDAHWHHKLGWRRVPNGDCIAFDFGPTPGAVIYLSHDGAREHGYVLGEDFQDFIDRHTTVACVGPECWQWSLFCDDPVRGIDVNHPSARLWREHLGFLEGPDSWTSNDQ